MSKTGTIKFGEDVNTNGISVSIYFTSCDFNCKNCINKEFQNYDYGFEFTKEIKNMFECKLVTNYIVDYIKSKIENPIKYLNENRKDWINQPTIDKIDFLIILKEFSSTFSSCCTSSSKFISITVLFFACAFSNPLKKLFSFISK